MDNEGTKKQAGGILSQLRDFGAGPLIGMGISLVTVPITTRLVSPQEFGKSAMFTLVQTLFTLVVLLGMDQSYVRFFNNPEIDKRKLLINSLAIPFFFCIFVLLVFFLFSEPISMFMFGQNEPLLMASFFIFLPALLINRFVFLSLRMELRGKAYSFLTLTQQIINVITLLALLLFYEKSFRSIVLSMIISTTISTVLAAIVSKQFFFKSSDFKLDLKMIKDLLLFGLPLVPATILSWVLNSFDKVALRTWSSFEELGLYAAAFKIISVLVIFQNIFATTWVPIAYKWYEEKVPFKKFEDVSNIVLSIMTISFAFIVVFRSVILSILGPEYRETSNIFVFLLFVPVLYTVSETTGLGIGFSKKTVYTLYISITTAVLNFFGNWILVPVYGAIGAAISTSVSYIVFFWLRTVFSNRLWLKMKLTKYIVNIILLVLFGVNMLTVNKYYVDLILVSIILIFNTPILWKIFKNIFLKGKTKKSI